MLYIQIIASFFLLLLVEPFDDIYTYIYTCVNWLSPLHIACGMCFGRVLMGVTNEKTFFSLYSPLLFCSFFSHYSIALTHPPAGFTPAAYTRREKKCSVRQQ